MLELDFASETENGKRVFVSATFERIHDYEDTRYGERAVFYWHLIGLKVKHSKCPHLHHCDCYQPTEDELTEHETDARKLASKEVA